MNTATYLSVDQIRERLGFHPESIRRLIRLGKLPALRIGRRLRINVADLEAFESSRRIVPPVARNSSVAHSSAIARHPSYTK